MTKFAQSALLAAILSLALASAAAQTLTGTITNGTTNKPAAGDEVILINLANGMDVAASTKADSSGKYSFKLTGEPGPHLIRAVHQGVTYHQMAPPGVNTADVNVYDVATKVADLGVTADVLRFQADSGTLQGVRLFVVSNTSSPAKTQMNDHNFEFYLPPGAKIEQVQARAPNGQPIAADATPESEKTSDKNRYADRLPASSRRNAVPGGVHSALLGPDQDRSQAAVCRRAPGRRASQVDALQGRNRIELPVHAGPQPGRHDGGSGAAGEARPAARLQPRKAPEPSMIVSRPARSASGAAQQQDQQPGRDNRPGGGLGAPIDAPDPLKKYQLYILGGFAVLLAIGGWVVTKRQSGVAVPGTQYPVPSAASSGGHSAVVRPAATAAPASAGGASSAKSSMLLEALKEEMFQLEVERKQGKITPAEYDKAKAALDQTLERALKRQS